MVETIGDNQIFYFQNHVVAGNLVEYRLGNFYVRSLVFYNHLRTQILVIKHRITTFFGAVQFQLYFVGQESFGVIFQVGQEVYEVLSYPFLGR